MNIQSLNNLVGGLPKVGLQQKEADATIFSDIYHSAINMVNETNTLQKQAEQSALSFAIGDSDNIHEVMIANDKATVALQYTVQIRDKVLEAYNEIMRMQI